jgi:hypothetical protein
MMIARLRRAANPFVLVTSLSLVAGSWLGCSSDQSELRDEETQVEDFLVQNWSPPAKQAADTLKQQAMATAVIETRYAAEIARLTPMLSREEVRGYSPAFEALPAVKKARLDYLAASESLDKSLADLIANPKMLSMVMNGIYNRRSNPDGSSTPIYVYGPREFYEALVLLAKTPFASRSLTIGLKILGNDPAYAKVSALKNDVLPELVEPALAFALGAELMQKPTTESALDALKETFLQFKSYGAPVGDLLSEFRGGAPADRVIAKIDARFQNALAGATLVLALWEVNAVAESAARGSYTQAINQAVRASGPLAQGVSAAASVYLAFTKASIASELGTVTLSASSRARLLATRVGQVAGRVAGGISVLTDSFQLITDTEAWARGTGSRLELVASALSAASSLASFLQVGAAGPILGALAFGAQLYVGYIKERVEEELQQAEMRSCLTAIRIPSGEMTTMLASHAPTLRDLQQYGDFTSTEVRTLVRMLPAVIERKPETDFLNFTSLALYKQHFRLTAAKNLGVILATAATESMSSKQALLRIFVVQAVDRASIADLGGADAISRTTILAYFDRLIAQQRMPERKAALQDARTYLQSQ